MTTSIPGSTNVTFEQHLSSVQHHLGSTQTQNEQSMLLADSPCEECSDAVQQNGLQDSLLTPELVQQEFVALRVNIGRKQTELEETQSQIGLLELLGSSKSKEQDQRFKTLISQASTLKQEIDELEKKVKTLRGLTNKIHYWA